MVGDRDMGRIQHGLSGEHGRGHAAGLEQDFGAAIWATDLLAHERVADFLVAGEALVVDHGLCLFLHLFWFRSGFRFKEDRPLS